MDGTHESAHVFISDGIVGIFESFAVHHNGGRWISNSRRAYPYLSSSRYPVEDHCVLTTLAVELSAACKDGDVFCVDIDAEMAVYLCIAGVLTTADFDQASADGDETMLVLPGVEIASHVVTLRIIRGVSTDKRSGVLALHRNES